jgi:hypothetical protein
MRRLISSAMSLKLLIGLLQAGSPSMSDVTKI